MKGMPKSKVKKIFRQFPSVRYEIEESHRPKQFPRVCWDVTVQRMDTDLMFFRGEHLDGLAGPCLVTRDGKQKLYGQKWEWTLFFDRRGKFLKKEIWWSFTRSRVIDILRTPNLYDSVATIVNVTWYEWYKAVEYREKGWKTPFLSPDLQFKAEEYAVEAVVVIYRLPSEGLKHLISRTDVEKNVRLNNQDMLRSGLDMDNTYDRVNQILASVIDQFVRKVFYRGLIEQIRKSRNRGFSGLVNGVCVRVYSVADRVLITLEQGRVQITLIGGEDEPDLKFYEEYGVPLPKHRLVWQSVDGTLPEIIETVRAVIRGWKENPKPENKRLKVNHKVSLV